MHLGHGVFIFWGFEQVLVLFFFFLLGEVGRLKVETVVGAGFWV